MNSGNAIHREKQTSIPHVDALTHPAYIVGTVSCTDSGELRPPISQVAPQARPNHDNYRTSATNLREQGIHQTNTYNTTTLIPTQHRQKTTPIRYRRRQSRLDRWQGQSLHRDKLLKQWRFHQGYNKFRKTLTPHHTALLHATTSYCNDLDNRNFYEPHHGMFDSLQLQLARDRES